MLNFIQQRTKAKPNQDVKKPKSEVIEFTAVQFKALLNKKLTIPIKVFQL